MERKDYLVLVNKQNKLPDNWEKIAELVEVKNSFGKILKIEKETWEKFNELRKDLLSQWVDIELDSAYRSFSIQNEFFEKFKEEYWDEYASNYAAPAGYSEHHTWLALDICIKKENGEIISENHEMIVELWVFDKVHKKMTEYGFILRYPDGKDNITWYSYEPWHLRYIWDVDIAKEIMENWLTLEEYLNNMWK